MRLDHAKEQAIVDVHALRHYVEASYAELLRSLGKASPSGWSTTSLPEMIATTPTDVFRREGQASCVAGWTDFVPASLVRRWEEKNPKVRELGDGRCAVVAYDFEIDYEMGGQLVEMRSRDLMTFEAEMTAGGWLRTRLCRPHGSLRSARMDS